MAITTNPLVWDFYREISESGTLGGVAHYYSEEAQSFWNTPQGLFTKHYVVEQGHWEESQLSKEILIDPLVAIDFDIDHTYNGTLFCASVNEDGELYFYRYIYSIDCSTLIASGSLDYSNNNLVSQIKVNIMNINEAIFQDEITVFQPGAKITFKLIVGDEIQYDMCVMYLDSSDYSKTSAIVPISGRNAIGFKLMDSTFDDTTSVTGTTEAVIASILNLAGITKYIIYESGLIANYKFEATQTLMSGIEQVLEYNFSWKLIELPSGLIVVGPSSFLSEFQVSDYYTFDPGTLFQRKIKRSSDAAYTKVRVTGKDAEDNNLIPIILPVNNWDKWALPKNKTYHHNAPGAFTQEELQAYAENFANTLQYVGIGEDYTGPIKPHLLIGDVASIDNGDGTITNLGIITSVKHKFGQSGYYTDFSINSGGIIMDNARSTNIVTTTKSLNGYTRRQTLKDMIQVASGSASAGPKTSGVITKVVNTANALTLEGKTYNQIIKAAVDAVPDELPDYTDQDYGKALVPGADGLIWQDVIEKATNAAIKAALDAVIETGAGNYIAPNIINYLYETTTEMTTHSRTYEGTAGNKLLLFIMHRGELTTSPEGWELLTVLEESGDNTAGTAGYIQYVSVFTKTCAGTEFINYEQVESTTSMTCFIEFEGISGFKILETTRQENIISDTAITCVRTSTYMAVWVATALYFNNNVFNWNISDNSIWAISDNHNVQPRLGVFVDNRPAPTTFTISSNMTGRYVSAICIQTIPIKTEIEDESQGEETQSE